MSTMGKQPLNRGEADVLIKTIIDLANELTENNDYPTIIIYPSGSYRRGLQVLGDLDLVVLTDCQISKPLDFQAFAGHVADVLEAEMKRCGDQMATMIGRFGHQVDLYACTGPQYPAMMQFTTGNMEHNKRLRTLAKRKRLKLNQYGLFRTDTNEAIELEDESDIYDVLGIPYLSPEERTQ